MRKFTNMLIVGLAILALQVVSMAQSSTHGSLTGTITDQQGAVVAGATVTLSSAVAGADRTAITDSNGTFDFQSLLPGTYSISVEAQGFKKSVAREIVVSVAQNTRVSVELDIGLANRSEEHTSELQSQSNLVCRLLLEKKKVEISERRV